MKFVTFCLFAILLIQATLASPKPFVFDTLGNIAQGIGDRIHNGINIASDFGSGITKGITGIYVNGLNAMETISKNIMSAINNKITRFTNRIILRVVDYAKVKLVDIQKRGENLILVAEQQLDDSRQLVNSTIQKLNNDLNDWSDKQAKKGEDASPETQEKIKALLDEQVESSLTDAQACGDSILQIREDLHNQAKQTVESSFPLIEDLVNKIGECARLDQRNIRATSECAGEVRRKLELLAPLPREYAKLLSQLNRVSIGPLDRAPCVAQTKEKMEKDKSEVEQKINELLKKDKESQVSTTQPSPSTTAETTTSAASTTTSTETTISATTTTN